jgi:hypothetical protein
MARNPWAIFIFGAFFRLTVGFHGQPEKRAKIEIGTPSRNPATRRCST